MTKEAVVLLYIDINPVNMRDDTPCIVELRRRSAPTDGYDERRKVKKRREKKKKSRDHICYKAKSENESTQTPSKADVTTSRQVQGGELKEGGGGHAGHAWWRWACQQGCILYYSVE